MPNARELVLKGLYKMEKDSAYSNKALLEILNNRELMDIDRGFVTELFSGVIRMKLRLDYIIAQFSKIKIKKLSPWVINILRMGIYQIIFMDGVPNSAACNESVKLSQKYANTGARGYINGVLRTVSREKDSIKYPKETVEFLSVYYSCPIWLTKKLTEQFSKEECEEILKSSDSKQRLTIRVNTLKTNAENLVEILAEEGIKADKNPDNHNCLYIDGALNITTSKAYKEGLYTLQNISSMAAVEYLAPMPDERVLDLCAAPGGKSTYIAELMKNKGEVVSFDIYSHKIQLIKNSADRLGITIIDAGVNNAEEFSPELENSFDRVLADVPCSGIGVIHKKPDIKWQRKEEDIEELAQIQWNILNNAKRYVKRNGVLVYSTCTILREENQDQKERFLKENPDFSLEKEELLLTHKTGGSGFYIAKFKRNN